MKVAKNAKSDPKAFFQIYKTKNKDRIGPLKKDDEMIENSEDMSKALNNYFLSVFTHENLTLLPGADQVFRERADERLTNIYIKSQQVI